MGPSRSLPFKRREKLHDRLRRRLLLSSLAPALIALPQIADGALPATTPGEADQPGERLAPWTSGMLDIHHIATGRGSATLVVMPDGTSLLIDAGATLSPLDVSAAPRPGASRRPGQWIARYAARHLAPTHRTGLDHVLVTHFHPDHLGDVNSTLPTARDGTHQLTGVMDVAAAMPIGTLIDRGHPAYDDPPAPDAPFARNYVAFVRARLRDGQRVERLRVGHDDQIRPLGGVRLPAPFAVRNVAANGIVWTGKENGTTALFPPSSTLAHDDLPTENMCSIALRIGYGAFGYFTGGDLTSYTDDGDRPWRDVLTPAARSAGPVDVATADHHGLFDGLSAEAVRALQPRAWVISTWHVSHPDTLQLERMLSLRLYPGARDVFATNLMPQNELANRRLVQRLRSTDGHVVIRVAPGGATFTQVVTDNRDEEDRVTLRLGPHAASSTRWKTPAEPR